MLTVPLCIGGGWGRGSRGGVLGVERDRGMQVHSNLTENMVKLHENTQNCAF